METRIKASGFGMTSAISAYLDERLAHVEKLLGAAGELTRCEVELGRDGGNQRQGKNIWVAEITLVRPGEAALRATNHSESINGAIDDVKDEISMQLRKSKQIERGAVRKIGARIKRSLRRGE